MPDGRVRRSNHASMISRGRGNGAWRSIVIEAGAQRWPPLLSLLSQLRSTRWSSLFGDRAWRPSRSPGTAPPAAGAGTRRDARRIICASRRSACRGFSYRLDSLQLFSVRASPLPRLVHFHSPLFAPRHQVKLSAQVVCMGSLSHCIDTG